MAQTVTSLTPGAILAVQKADGGFAQISLSDLTKSMVATLANSDQSRMVVSAAPTNIDAIHTSLALAGTAASNYTHPTAVQSPSSIRQWSDGSFSTTDQTKLIIARWSVASDMSIALESSFLTKSTTGVLMSPVDHAIDEAAQRIYAISGQRQLVCYDYNGDEQWRWGIYNSQGNIDVGKLYYPESVDVDSMGHIYVACKNGNNDGSTLNQGTVTQFVDNGDSAAVVAVRADSSGNRHLASYPVHRIHEDKMFVANSYSTQLDVYDIEPDGAWTLEQSYNLNDLAGSLTFIKGIGITDDQIIVADDKTKQLVSIDRTTGAELWRAGRYVQDASEPYQQELGGFYGLRHILPLELPGMPLRVLVCDYSNHRITSMPPFGEITLQYAPVVPEGYEVDAEEMAKLGYDAETNTRTLNLNTDAVDETFPVIYKLQI